MSLTDLIETLPAEQRNGALAVLDHLSRPMTQGEIAAHLRRNGISRARAAKIAGVVAPMHIVALIGDGGQP